MILLMTTAASAAECAVSLLTATRKKVHVAADFRQAMAFLRDHDISALVFDESTVVADGYDAANLLKHAGAAIPVRVNFAIYNQERINREVQDALHRFQRERVVAQRAARGELISLFTEDVTGLLIASQLALKDGTLTGAAKQRVEEVCRLAGRLSERLKAGA